MGYNDWYKMSSNQLVKDSVQEALAPWVDLKRKQTPG